jgi:hypothetical protein
MGNSRIEWVTFIIVAVILVAAWVAMLTVITLGIQQ